MIVKISSVVFCPMAALLPVLTLFRLPKNLSTMALDTGRQNSSLIKSSILFQRFDPIERWKSLYQVMR